MNKTVSINLAGLVFQIDEKAYELLSSYLENLQNRFRDENERGEIIRDIEARIAEVFNQKVGPNKEVITEDEVKEVIALLGDPSDIASDEDETFEATTDVPRKLFRDEDNKILGGVISGLSHYFGIVDPIWMRLLMVILVVFGVGSPILIYLLLWAIVPAAKTSSEKLQMKGRPVTIENIERAVKEEYESIRNSLSNGSGKKKASSGIRRLFGLLINIFAYLFQAAGKIVAFFLLLGCLAVLTVITMTQFGLLFPPLMEMGMYMASSKTQLILWDISLFMVIAIPLIFIVMLSLRILVSDKMPMTKSAAVLGVLWIGGLIMLLGTTAWTARDFSKNESVVEQFPLDQPFNDTMYVNLAAYELKRDSSNTHLFFGSTVGVLNDEGFWDEIEMDVQMAKDDKFGLSIRRSAFGRNAEQAQLRAGSILLPIRQAGNELYLPTSLSIPSEQKWRDQEVLLSFRIPERSVVIFEEAVLDMISGSVLAAGLNSSELAGRALVMKDGKLSCLDCPMNDSADVGIVSTGSALRSISLKGGFELHLEQAETFEIIFEDEGDRNNVDIRQTASSLSLEADLPWFEDDMIEILIRTPELDKLHSEGAASIEIDGFVTDLLELRMEGASELDIEALDVQRLNLRLSGASDAEISGSATDLSAELTGACSMDGRKLQTVRANIEITGAGEASISVSEELNGRVLGAGELTYYGEPHLKIERFGAASVEKGDE